MNLPAFSPGVALLCLAVAACSPAESRNATTTSDHAIGILQCDDYLTRVNTCIQGNVPAGERAALTAETRQMFTTWKEAAADPQQRATLPQACSITHEVAREDLARYGCAL